jgi:hypothetical protein
MKCAEIRQHFADYLYGELPAVEAAQVAEHLGQCAACRGELRQLQSVQKWLAYADGGEPAAGPPLHAASVLRRAWSETESSRRRWRRAAYGVATMAAVVLVVWFASLRVEVQRSRLTIVWGRPPADRPVLTDNILSVDVKALAGSIAAQQTRLEELERLTRLLEQVTDAEHRKRLRELVVLESELRTIALRNDTRWNTVTQVIRRGVHGEETPLASSPIVDGEQP